ncbi:MAG: NAD(P)H-quinone oxidoreductase [Chloroflexi bacterium]|nr:NAD(P)H-quinone oxidoreductase [Chloroflexota bacterium]
MKALRIEEYGSVEVLEWKDATEPSPSPHQVLIKVDSAGVNYADIMRRQGNYPGPDLPATLGLEASGTITELGSDVTDGRLAVGQKVMAMGPQGQAEYVAVNASFVFPYPDSIDAVHAGGMPITFLTSYHLLKSRGGMQPGDTVLIQAGASGVGTVAIQLAKEWGARVIATASTEDKLELCRSLGADITINYTEVDFEEEVKSISDGRGVALVLECVGGPVLEKSVRCVASYGRLVSYGNASGQPANLSAADITTVNRTVIGFSMGRSPIGSLDHQGAMDDLIPLITGGKLKLIVDRVLPMSEAGDAHLHLASRGTRGKVILTP